MPDPNPLSALRKATSLSSARPKLPELTQSMMPMTPSGLWAGLTGAAKVVPEAVQGLQKAVPAIQQLGPETNAVMSRMYNAAHPAFQALQDAGAYAGERTTGALQSIWPEVKTLGEMAPDFTPVGAEDVYNLGKQGLQQAVDPVARAYQSIATRGVR